MLKLSLDDFKKTKNGSPPRLAQPRFVWASGAGVYHRSLARRAKHPQPAQQLPARASSHPSYPSAIFSTSADEHNILIIPVSENKKLCLDQTHCRGYGLGGMFTRYRDIMMSSRRSCFYILAFGPAHKHGDTTCDMIRKTRHVVS